MYKPYFQKAEGKGVKMKVKAKKPYSHTKGHKDSCQPGAQHWSPSPTNFEQIADPKRTCLI